MSKLDDLTKVAAGLSDQQLDGLLDYARTLADESFFANAPPDAKEAIKRGLAQHSMGLTESGEVVFQSLRQRLLGVSKTE